ncbi:MAG: hypothetical protein JWL79_2883 [Frankiales bacterium]|jgi:hypothetical protein|nr:hypothetical protein [Frankiales bacterium]
MWPFRRRRVGKHALGAAVTAIPRVVPAVPAAVVPPPPPPPAQVVEEPPRPRVELGFRDGSTAALAPESAQAKALTDIASVLTRRD